jgi:hypothetical protein
MIDRDASLHPASSFTESSPPVLVESLDYEDKILFDEIKKGKRCLWWCVNYPRFMQLPTSDYDIMRSIIV